MRNLMILLGILLVTPALASPGHGHDHGHDHGKQAKHKMYRADGMPNLMSIVVKQSAALKLTKAQSDTLAEFRKTAMPARMALGQKIMKDKKALLAMALGDANKAAIVEKHTALRATTLAFFEFKIKCRTLMKKTLTPAQWTQLVTMHNKRAAAHAH